MAREIKSVAVMGAGTMGAGIAAHCASKGFDVLLLDLPAKEGDRNAIALGAKDRMVNGKPAALDDAADAERIAVGNFEDDIAKVADYDLIVEAVAENLEIKRGLFERLEAARRDGSVLSTNTSGIPLKDIAAGMPERLRRDIAVTHFFNPVKVMKLVELVPGEDTEAEVIDGLAQFIDGGLGKGVVWAKDTVNFIANRIGCFWMLAGLHEADKAFAEGLTIEDIDAAMSAPVGVPATGLFGLVDLIGLDVMHLVAENLAANLGADDVGRQYASFPPKIEAMHGRGQLGRKAGGGFYRMRKTDDGGRLKETFDLGTEDWRDAATAALDADHQTLPGLLMADDALGRFAWRVMGATLLYAADLVPDIADDIVNVDRAMRWGFAWRQGPFEMLDALGPAKVIDRLKAEGKPLPKMLAVLQDAGADSFYRNDGAEFLGVDGQWHAVS